MSQTINNLITHKSQYVKRNKISDISNSVVSTKVRRVTCTEQSKKTWKRLCAAEAQINHQVLLHLPDPKSDGGSVPLTPPRQVRYIRRSLLLIALWNLLWILSSLHSIKCNYMHHLTTVIKIQIKYSHLTFVSAPVQSGPKRSHFSIHWSLEPFKIKWSKFHQNVPKVSGNKD